MFLKEDKAIHKCTTVTLFWHPFVHVYGSLCQQASRLGPCWLLRPVMLSTKHFQRAVYTLCKYYRLSPNQYVNWD